MDPQQQPPQPPQPPQLLQLIDEEEWFNLYGLRQAGDIIDDVGNNNVHNSTANDRETAARVASESSYQNEIHAKIFATEDEEHDTDDDGKRSMAGGVNRAVAFGKRRRSEQLEQWKEETIDVRTTKFCDSINSSSIAMATNSDGEKTKDEIVVIRTNLKELAARSDTVFAMASNQHLFHKNDDDDDTNTNTNTNTHKIDPHQTQGGCPRLSLSLREYSTESVRTFLTVLLSLPLSQIQYQSLPQPQSQSHKTSRKTVVTTTIPPEFVIDCCRLAHYLQCQQLLDSIVDDYLMAPGSIDHENCRFLCKLADELSLPRLWEASVNHMLSSLDKFDNSTANKNKNTTSTSTTDNNESENHDGATASASASSSACLWDDLSPALKTEIQALRGILRSSNRTKMYFSTYHEYLGLLAEQHQYYKERLEDAQNGLAVRITEEARCEDELRALEAEKASNLLQHYQNTRLDRAIETAQSRLRGLSKGRLYAASKIDHQRKKVETLRALWKEQKQVFGGGGSSSSSSSRSFERYQIYDIYVRKAWTSGRRGPLRVSPYPPDPHPDFELRRVLLAVVQYSCDPSSPSFISAERSAVFEPVSSPRTVYEVLTNLRVQALLRYVGPLEGNPSVRTPEFFVGADANKK